MREKRGGELSGLEREELSESPAPSQGSVSVRGWPAPPGELDKEALGRERGGSHSLLRSGFLDPGFAPFAVHGFNLASVIADPRPKRRAVRSLELLDSSHPGCGFFVGLFKNLHFTQGPWQWRGIPGFLRKRLSC